MRKELVVLVFIEGFVYRKTVLRHEKERGRESSMSDLVNCINKRVRKFKFL
jgi:hypothetical protein